MAKQKILFLINSLRFGGAERVVSMMANHLRADYEIHLALLYKEIAFPISGEIPIVDLKENPNSGNVSQLIRLPFIARELNRYCKKNTIELVISFLNRPSYITAFMKSCWGYKGKIIMCERSYQSQILKYIGNQSSLYRLITKKLIHYSYQQAHLVIANSKLSKIDLQNNFAVTTPIEVIYNPVDVAAVQQLSGEEKPGCFADEGIFYFIAIGNFRTEKNFELLLHAFALIHQSINTKLILVGSGSLENKLKQVAADLDISSQVHFSGFQQNPYKYIKNADCLVLSSYTEGFPNILLEAMACNKAIVSTDCQSGPRELLAPSTDPLYQTKSAIEIAEYGILTAVNDARALAEGMTEIYNNKNLRTTLENKAALRVADFNIDINIKQYHLAIQSVLKNKKPL